MGAKLVLSLLQVQRAAANVANYILWSTVKLSKLSKTQSRLMTVEHPNIDLMLLTTPASYFCVTISKVILYTKIVAVVYVSHRSLWQRRWTVAPRSCKNNNREWSNSQYVGTVLWNFCLLLLAVSEKHKTAITMMGISYFAINNILISSDKTLLRILVLSWSLSSLESVMAAVRGYTESSW